MQQTDILHKRNQFIYSSYFTFFILHCISVFLGFFEFRYQYPYFSLAFLTMIGTALAFKYNSRIVQMSIVIGLNILLLILIWQSYYIFNIFWLIFFLLLITIYKSHSLNFIMTTIIFIESILLLMKHPYTDVIYDIEDILFISCFLFVILVLVVFVQTFYIRSMWQKIEQKNIKKENELLSTEAYLKLFFEHANDAIAVFDLEDRIIEVNPAFEKLYGWSREECIGKNIPLVPPTHTIAAKNRHKRLLKGESITLHQAQDMRKDGTVFDSQISLSPIYNHQKEVVALSVISRDISYIKDNERLLLNAEKLKLAGEIAAGVAHEIRNPMTVISGFVQMMNAEEHSPYKEYTKLIQGEIERIDLIISEFLVLSRPQAMNGEQFDINDALQEVLSLFQLEIENRRIMLEHKPSQELAIIYGNKNQIKQVIINLIKNAIEAIYNGGTIKAEISVENQVVSILIKDDGIGIPEHIMKHIFEPFYTTKSKGTGLGMMITNKIIQDHKGEIKVCSKEDVGTDILVRLPLFN